MTDGYRRRMPAVMVRRARIFAYVRNIRFRDVPTDSLHPRGREALMFHRSSGAAGFLWLTYRPGVMGMWAPWPSRSARTLASSS